LAFVLSIPRTDAAEPLRIELTAGQTLFVLGANGTGKSSLMQRLCSQHVGRSRRISAHRQTWFTSGSITVTPDQKVQYEASMQNTDSSVESRWKDDWSPYRATMAIYDVLEAENARSRSIAAAVDADNISLAK